MDGAFWMVPKPGWSSSHQTRIWELASQWLAVLLQAAVAPEAGTCGMKRMGEGERAQQVHRKPGRLCILCCPGQCGGCQSGDHKPGGLPFPSALSPARYPSCCFLFYELDQKISNALPALRSYDLDKSVRGGWSFQPSPPFLVTDLGVWQ